MLENLGRCPLCRSSKIGVLYAARDTINRLPGEFFLSRCGRCGLRFQNPRVRQDEIGRFYPDTTSYYTAPFDPDRIKLDPYRKLWASRTGMSLLDVGCAFGKHLLIARRLGLEAEGVEPNPAAALKGKDLGLKIAVTTFEDFAATKKYDIIVASMVLEHVYDFDSFLEKCYTLLENGGRIVLEIPTYSGALLIFGPDSYPLHLPNHLYFFSKRNIEYLLKKHGFRSVSTRCIMSADDFKKSVALAAESRSAWLAFSRLPLLVRIAGKVYENLARIGFSSRISVRAFR